MPLFVIRGDIARMQVDAVVNTGSACGEAADICEDSGRACRYVIRSTDEIWHSGLRGTKQLQHVFDRAREKGVRSIAFQLAAGDDAKRQAAADALRRQLDLGEEMDVYLVGGDQEAAKDALSAEIRRLMAQLDQPQAPALPDIGALRLRCQREIESRRTLMMQHAAPVWDHLETVQLRGLFDQRIAALMSDLDTIARADKDAQWKAEAIIRAENQCCEYLKELTERIARVARRMVPAELIPPTGAAHPAKGSEENVRHSLAPSRPARLVPPPMPPFAPQREHYEYTYQEPEKTVRDKSVPPIGLLSLDDMLHSLDAGFSDTLIRLIDERGMKDSECYKRANVDKKLFSKIRSNPDYKPKKTTAVAFAIALRLTLAETNDLLKRAGLVLTHASAFDIIVEYFISQGMYDIDRINQELFDYDMPLLGSGLS